MDFLSDFLTLFIGKLQSPTLGFLIGGMVVAAVNKALAEVDEQVKEEMKKHTDGLLPNIPGLDLTGL